MSGILKSVSAIRIFVDDLDKARLFYRDTLQLREKAAEAAWALFDVDGKDIVLEEVASDDPERDLVGRLLAVSFGVDDIEEAYRELRKRGVVFEEPPEKQAWGGTLAFARDPAGNVLTLVG